MAQRILFIISLLILFSCNVEKIVNTEPDSKIINRFSKTTILKSYVPMKNFSDSIIFDNTAQTKVLEPDKPTCGYKYIDGWVFHHFEQKDGRYLGIWPNGHRINIKRKLRDLKDRWRFKYIYFNAIADESVWNDYFDAGFSSNEIMVRLYKKYNPDPIARIDTFSDAYAFYIDEPYSHPDGSPMYTNIEYINLSNHIHSATSSKLIIGDYKKSCISWRASYADDIMVSSYKDWIHLAFCIYTPSGDDQRPLWSDFKDRFGDKSTMNWVNQKLDLNEFTVLLGHARNLGQKVV